MSSSEADSEISYDSEGSGESFLDEIEVEHEVMHATPTDYSPCSSDDESAAYADDPLADAELTANYEKEIEASEEQEETLRERFEGSVEVCEW